MRSVYLIRHGHPDFPLGTRICLGQTDTPLGPLGRLQSVLLAHVFAAKPPARVYTSPLRRAYDTAHYLSKSPIVIDSLTERATGLWDGLTFDEIARRWPKEYAQRGENPTLTMPEGEDLEHAATRFANAIEDILRHQEGDAAIVAHKGVIGAFMLALNKNRRLPSLPYGAYWHLTAENHTLTLKEHAPAKPQPTLNRALCLTLLHTVAPKQVVCHCEAVEAFALEIAAQLPLALDTTLIAQAALLHDIARTMPNHAQIGAQWLEALGYPAIANIVRQHHDINTTHINEASLVYLADKCLQGTQRVSLRARFSASKAKCQSKEAQAAWERRWHAAETLQKTINTYCGKEIIQ